MRSHLTVLAAYAGLTCLVLWPLGPLNPWATPAHHDVTFSIWRLAWVAHQLTQNPSQLFDTNIFHPEPATLAYSDAMLLLGLAGTPLQWAGVHPILVHNLLLLAAFPASAFAAYLLALDVTTRRGPAFVAGVIFAFAHYRIAHVVHLELAWTMFMPLSVLFLRRCMRTPTSRAGMRLGASVGMQALCSIYYAVLLAPVLLVYAVVLAAQAAARPWRQWMLAGLTSVVVAGVLVSPYVAPYTRSRAIVGARPVEEVMRYSATPEDFLKASRESRVYPEARRADTDEHALFPGVLPTALTVAALVQQPVVALPFFAMGATGLDLSLGVNGWSFSALGTALPFLGNLRAPARAGVIVLLATAVLAAMSLTPLVARLSRPRAALAVGVVALLCVADYWSAPLATAQLRRVPGTLQMWMATQPPGTVAAYLPLPEPFALWGAEPEHQYQSIYHWQPMVNGYSGFAPPSYIDLLRDMRGFPDARSFAALGKRGVQVVIADSTLMGGEQYLRVLNAWIGDPSRAQPLRFAQPRGEAAVLVLPARSPGQAR